MFLAALALWLFAPALDAFTEGDASRLRLWVLGSATVVLVFWGLANLSAVRALRGSSAARWALVALCFPTALLGIMGGYYIAPLAVSLAALVVAFLLLLPASRAWFGRATVT